MDRDPMMNCTAGVLIRQPPGLWEDPPVMSAPRTRTPRFLSRSALGFRPSSAHRWSYFTRSTPPLDPA